MSSRYRPDIDGLRAIAVTAVLGFHAFPGAMPGGFTGVDIFFVISGFLISGIILEALRDGTFTFRDFYARRIRRIFPALALVLAATAAFGWLALSPYDFDQIGAHIAAGATFVANILLWRESGYFDTDSASKPLMHLWSLGVEEQYYAAWPVLLFALRHRLRRVPWLILAVATASFVLNVLAVEHYASAAFYLPFTRFWELMLGSGLAWGYMSGTRAGVADGGPRSAIAANLYSIVGLLLLAVTFATVQDGRGFPGWRALLPTVAAALLIHAGPRALFNKHVLASRPFVYIGLISYPLYLWHWPLLAYSHIVLDEKPSLAIRLTCVASAVVLASATYVWVERPIRRLARVGNTPRTVAVSAASVAALGIYGLMACTNLTQARSDSIPQLTGISAAYADWHYKGDRTIAGESQETVMFFGDSHMQQFLPRIEALMEHGHAGKRTVVFHTRGGCAPVPGINRPGYDCDKFVAAAYEDALQPRIGTVIISASWAGFVDREDYYRAGDENGEPLQILSPGTEWILDGFERAVTRLTQSGKQVVIVLSSPFGPQLDPHNMARRDGLGFQVTVHDTWVPRRVLDAAAENIDNRLVEIAQRAHASVLDPLDFTCTGEICPTVDEQGNPVMKDFSHLRSSYVATRFNAFDRFVLVSGKARMSEAMHPAVSQ